MNYVIGMEMFDAPEFIVGLKFFLGIARSHFSKRVFSVGSLKVVVVSFVLKLAARLDWQ
jgi:hypothetical protein